MRPDAVPAYVLRPVTPEDRSNLLALYATTREDELAQVPWSEAEKSAFMEFQFGAQTVHYEREYPEADHAVVLVDGRFAGRVYVHRGPFEIRLLDLALMPAYRNHGIGSAVLRSLQDDAAAAAVPVVLHVEIGSPARRLYERLGFEIEEAVGHHERMSWRP